MRDTVLLLMALATLPALAAAEVPKVVTDMPVVQSLAAQVMGDLGTPETLLDHGANPHSYQMKPSQARALQKAELLFWVGPEMTPWLSRAIGSVDAGLSQIALLHSDGTHRQTYLDDADNDGHGHEDEHKHEHHGDHDHAHQGPDPHAWLDPRNAGNWVTVMAAALAKADPGNAATYAANASAARERIDALDKDLRRELAPVKDRPFIVFHAAYGYFATHYGLQDEGSVAFGDATDPGAAHLSDLRADLKAKGVVCAFPEVSHDPRPMQRLIEGTQVRLGPSLDPEGTQLAPGPDLYDRLMRAIGENLSACLGR